MAVGREGLTMRESRLALELRHAHVHPFESARPMARCVLRPPRPPGTTAVAAKSREPQSGFGGGKIN